MGWVSEGSRSRSRGSGGGDVGGAKDKTSLTSFSLAVCREGGVQRPRPPLVPAERSVIFFWFISFLLLVVLARAASLILASYPLAAPALLIAVAQATALLLVPSTQWLTAKGEVGIVDDGGLHPGVGAEVNLAGGRVESLQIGDDVVIRGRFGG